VLHGTAPRCLGPLGFVWLTPLVDVVSAQLTIIFCLYRRTNFLRLAIEHLRLLLPKRGAACRSCHQQLCRHFVYVSKPNYSVIPIRSLSHNLYIKQGVVGGGKNDIVENTRYSAAPHVSFRSDSDVSSVRVDRMLLPFITVMINASLQTGIYAGNAETCHSHVGVEKTWACRQSL